MTRELSSILPPLRRKIRKSFFLFVALYGILGGFMITCVFLASGMTPKLIHVNYDSISAAKQMSQSWQALKDSQSRFEKPPSAQIESFERSLRFAEGNVTEPGEKEITETLRALWNRVHSEPLVITEKDDHLLNETLEALVQVNEKGMFGLAKQSTAFRNQVLFVTLLFFTITLILAIFLSDGLAHRLASPIKEIAEALRSDPSVEHRLKLPRPTSFELRILTTEMNRLWERLGRFHKLNVEELAAERERLETVLESIEDAVLVVDNSDRVLKVSDGMLQILGLSRMEVVDQAWSDLSTSRQNYLTLRERLKSPLIPDNGVELMVEGRKRILAARMRDIVTLTGQKIGKVYLFHDITETRQRERLKAEFIGVLSHELKTPLQSLGTAAELLCNRKERLDEDTSTLVETIHEDVARIRAVANDFMQVSVVDLHALKLKLERLPLSDLIQDWIKPFRVLARDKNVTIEFIKEGSETIWANLDIVKLPWAISNLLANAIRVSEPQAKVTVFISDRSQMAEIEIRDEGPGIPAEVQAHMFEPYYQGGPESGKTGGLLGLGLTIAKEVVEAHDGHLEYFSRRPQGSVFRISIPFVMVYS